MVVLGAGSIVVGLVMILLPGFLAEGVIRQQRILFRINIRSQEAATRGVIFVLGFAFIAAGITLLVMSALGYNIPSNT